MEVVDRLDLPRQETRLVQELADAVHLDQVLDVLLFLQALLGAEELGVAVKLPFAAVTGAWPAAPFCEATAEASEEPDKGEAAEPDLEVLTILKGGPEHGLPRVESDAILEVREMLGAVDRGLTVKLLEDGLVRDKGLVACDEHCEHGEHSSEKGTTKGEKP